MHVRGAAHVLTTLLLRWIQQILCLSAITAWLEGELTGGTKWKRGIGRNKHFRTYVS